MSDERSEKWGLAVAGVLLAAWAFWSCTNDDTGVRQAFDADAQEIAQAREESAAPTPATWTLKHCLDNAGGIGVALYFGDSESVNYAMDKAARHGCDVDSDRFVRAVADSYKSTQNVEEFDYP